MTPGSFLRKAREAVGLTLLDVALRTETTPAVAASERARLLGAIEADLVEPFPDELETLHAFYRFSWADLAACERPVAEVVRPLLRRAA